MRKQNEFGKFLEELRSREGLTLRKAAEKSGLSHTYIRDLELGINRKTKAPIHPTPETLKRLAAAYNYPYEALMMKAGYITQDYVSKELENISDDELILKMLNSLTAEDKDLFLDLLKRLHK